MKNGPFPFTCHKGTPVPWYLPTERGYEQNNPQKKLQKIFYMIFPAAVSAISVRAL